MLPCPACNASVGNADKVCPECGASMIPTVGYQTELPPGPDEEELKSVDEQNRILAWKLLAAHVVLALVLWKVIGSGMIAAGIVLVLAAVEAALIDMTILFPFCLMFALLGAAASHAADAAVLSEFGLQFGPGQRVFEAGDDNDWDAAIRERGWILKEGSQWRMWYTGYDGTRPGQKKLGLATSPDGVHWTRHPDNPIYDELWVEDMQVVRHDGEYLMFAEGTKDHAQLLTSNDGVAWTRVGGLDIRQTSGEPLSPGPFGTPTAYFEDGTWYLFYERYDQGIWLATSNDLKTFTNVQDAPVLTLGPDEYDELMIALNQIVKLGDTYYAFYHGTGTPTKPREWCVNIAISPDLIHWTKYPGNPLFPPEQNKSSGILVHDGEDWRLYTMHGQVEMHLPAR